jgi:uncharacterized protein with PCYCGC motif
MSSSPAFPRRDFLIGVLGFGSLTALGATTLPGLPTLVQDANTPLPGWATGTARTARAYRIALRRSGLLADLNCYCGCMQSAELQHQNLRDCFLYVDGSLNQHAAGCGICQAEAVDAERWATQGWSSEKIRQQIDDAYGAAVCTVDRCVE